MLKHDGKTAISKCLLFSALIVLLMFASSQFNMDCAYAVDVNDSSEIGVDLDLEDEPINSQDNEILEVNNQDSQELLKATRTPSGNTYKSIQDEIDEARDGDTILLKGTYHSTGDYIRVKKRLTIMSDSTAVLDGKHQSIAFFLYAESAGSMLKNLKFINGKGSVGSAVIVYAKNVRIQNCIFEDNHANTHGAVKTRADLETSAGLIVDNCQFRRNTAYFDDLVNESNSAALSMFGRDSEVKNCIFEDNMVKGKFNSYGGAIQVGLDEPGSNGKVTNCIFINNSAKSNNGNSHGGAGCVRSGTAYTNCIFIGNSAGEGGALTFHGSGEIKNCSFIDNHANNYGGALSTGLLYDYMELTVTDCNFEGNDAPMGGAIQANGKNVIIDNSNFNDNNVSKYGGAIYARADDVTIKDSTFNSNKACIDGGAIYIEGKDTVIQNSSFVSNEAIPDVNKIDDGLGGAIYVNSSQALIKSNSFRFNTARNGSAIYYDKEGQRLTLENNELFQNQAWVYQLPIHAEDIYYGDSEEIRVVLFGGNNIADFDNLQVSNAIFNAADNVNIVIDGEYPVYGATDSGDLYQDSREYNIDVHLTVNHEDGTVVYDGVGHTSYLGEIVLDLDNLKPGKYFVTAKHYEDTYYKAISNATTFIVSPKVDIEVKKAISKDVADYEDVVTWTITVRNNGPNDATNIRLLDVLPEGLIWLSDTSDERYDHETGTMRLENLNVNEEYSFEIVTVISATGMIINKANVTSNEFDSNLTNNYAEKGLFVNPAADLSVTKSVSDSNSLFNDIIRWTIEVVNNGPDVAHNVTVIDLLPKTLVWIGDDSLMDYNHLTGELFLYKMDVGESYVLNIDCRVNGTGLIHNNVSVCASEYDYDLTNNFANETVSVEKSADVSVIKSVNNSSPNYGDLVKWTLRISNIGPDNATNVYVEDFLPEGLRLLSYNATKGFYDEGIWAMCCLNNGDVETLEMICRVERTGEFLNLAAIHADEYDYNQSNNEDNESIDVPLAIDLQVMVEANNTNPLFGQAVNWMITVINNGPDNATGAILEDILPEGLVFLEYESSKGILENEVWDIGSLDVGDVAYLNITTLSNALGEVINAANVNAQEYDWNISNNHDEDLIHVRSVADLSITKLVDKKSPKYGEIVKWTLVALNQGPNTAHNVLVHDILPKGLTFISSNGQYCEGIWDVGSLDVGEEKSIEIICRVTSTGDFINLATIEGDELDIDESDNQDDESIHVEPASDLSVTKIASGYYYHVGDVIEYVIEISNNGPDVARNVKVTDVLDNLLKLKSFKASKGRFDRSSNAWTIDSLVSGESAKLIIRVIAVGLGIVNNSAIVTSDTFDHDLSNNQDSALINVTEKSSNEPYVPHNTNIVKKAATVLEIHPTANPIVVLLISSIFTMLLTGVRISKK